MAKSSLERWEEEFRKAAKGDNFVLMRDHMHRLSLPMRPPQSMRSPSIFLARVSLAC